MFKLDGLCIGAVVLGLILAVALAVLKVWIEYEEAWQARGINRWLADWKRQKDEANQL